MKVIVTGHTKGIGKGIFEYFLNQDHKTLGFSRSTGFDISNVSDRNKILQEALDADIFVNNAFKDNDAGQLDMLKEIFQLWKNQNKTIINISSRAAGIMDTDYARSKLLQDKFCESVSFLNPTIINLKPGLTDTDRVRHINGHRMSVDNVVRILDFILNNSLKIHSITFGK